MIKVGCDGCKGVTSHENANREYMTLELIFHFCPGCMSNIGDESKEEFVRDAINEKLYKTHREVK